MPAYMMPILLNILYFWPAQLPELFPIENVGGIDEIMPDFSICKSPYQQVKEVCNNILQDGIHHLHGHLYERDSTGMC